LAFNLAHYRAYPDSQSCYLGAASAKEFTVEFWPEDEKIIQRLLTSNAIKDTTIDHGFLEYMFDRPNMTGRSNFSFEFLQEVVFHIPLLAPTVQLTRMPQCLCVPGKSWKFSGKGFVTRDGMKKK
jgi:hypothetical protein